MVESLSITVAVAMDTYDRGQDVEVTGTVLGTAGDPVVNVPVEVAVRSATSSRVFTVYTDAQGDYRYTFRPLAGEAGSYTVEAAVRKYGLRRTATDTFRILGLWLQPASQSLQLSMNATRTVDLTLRNVGDLTLTGLQYQVEDLDPADPLTGSVAAGLPDSLTPGASVTVPLLLTTAAGDAPAAPAQVQVRVTSAEGSVETSTVTVTLKNAEAEPVIEPDPFKVGVKPGETVTRTVTVTNGGYAPVNSAVLALREAASYPWVQVLSGDLGSLDPQQSKEVQVRVSPPAESALGVHFLHLDLDYDGQVKSASAEIEIVAAETGAVAVQVHDDTGSVVAGAEVSLISKAFYISTAPDGSTQEYNNVIQGNTNAAGALALSDVPAGEYRYLVQAPGHDPFEGEMRVEAGTDPQALGVIMVTNLVNVDFRVTPTTITDEYDITLEITYATNLTKPALYVKPSPVGLSFFPEETQSGVLTVKNTSNNAPVRDVVMSAAMLDTTDNELEVVFTNGLKAILLPDLGPGEYRAGAIHGPHRGGQPAAQYAVGREHHRQWQVRVLDQRGSV